MPFTRASLGLPAERTAAENETLKGMGRQAGQTPADQISPPAGK